VSAVIDEIERLGAEVDRGELDPGEAAHRIMQCTGGTLDDAAELVRHWKMVPDSCDALVAQAADVLLALALGIDATGGAS
jgi:hypothetical protein